MRPSPSSRPQCRRYGCRTGRRFRPDSPAECHGRCTPGRRRSVPTRPSPTFADDAVDRRRLATRQSGADRVRRPGANRARRRPPSRTSRPPGSDAGLRCHGHSRGEASMVGDVRERHGGSELRAGGAGKRSGLRPDDDEQRPRGDTRTERHDAPSRPSRQGARTAPSGSRHLDERAAAGRGVGAVAPCRSPCRGRRGKQRAGPTGSPTRYSASCQPISRDKALTQRSLLC